MGNRPTRKARRKARRKQIKMTLADKIKRAEKWIADIERRLKTLEEIVTPISASAD
jgi:hypothetical protein